VPAAPSVAAKLRLMGPSSQRYFDGTHGALYRAGRTDRRAKQLTLFRLVGSSLMKGHEDGG